MLPFLSLTISNSTLSQCQYVLTVLLRREAEEADVDRRDVSVERGRDGVVFGGLAPLGTSPDDFEGGL